MINTCSKTMAGTGFLSGALKPGAPRADAVVRIHGLNHSFGEGDSSKQALFEVELEESLIAGLP